MFLIGVCVVFCYCILTATGNTENEIDKTTSVPRYKLNITCELLLRQQVNTEMHASLVYMGMAAYFDRNNVARAGFAKFFSENSEEEREHAQKIIRFLNKRGGKFTEFKIKMPKTSSWECGLDAIKEALELEHVVNDKLNHIHDVAEDICKDKHLMDFIESDFLTEQVESIDRLKRYEAILSAMSDSSLSEYLFDRQLLYDDDEYKHKFF